MEELRAEFERCNGHKDCLARLTFEFGGERGQAVLPRLQPGWRCIVRAAALAGGLGACSVPLSLAIACLVRFTAWLRLTGQAGVPP